MEHNERVLAIDPTSSGFGYVVMESPRELIDWGIKEARNNKNYHCLKQINALINRYRPTMVVVEECKLQNVRRCGRVRDLIEDIIRLTGKLGIRHTGVSRYEVRRVFGEAGRNKDRVAYQIAQIFPELANRLPPICKPWMNEDSRMSIFDAAAMALTHFSFTRE